MQLEGHTDCQGGCGCVLLLRAEQRTSATAQTLLRSSGVVSAGFQAVAGCPGKVQGLLMLSGLL